MFCKHGTCRDPRSEGEVDSLVAPTEIKEMLRLSSGWHLTSDYWGVNLFKDWNEDEVDTSEEKAGMWMDKTIIIGDAEMVKEWECFATLSEYDYLFVCVIPGEQFGATRHIVNNCWEDTPFTPAPFGCFLEKLVEHVAQVDKHKETVAGNKTEEG